MKHYTLIYTLLVALAIFFSFCDSYAVVVSPAGFGADTAAGEGGLILRVTNLESRGTGSLRNALSGKGSRIIVFEVGGVIDLKKEDIAITEPFLTVAGQTAPSPGITLIKGGIVVKTHDVLIQHIRVRPGDAGQSKSSGWEPDGLTTAGKNAYNIIIDHCSFSWAVDENLSASGPGTQGPDFTSRKVTFSNNIIAEGLNSASHSKGSHSKGTLVHDFCTDIAIVGNLYAHNVARSPYFKAHTTGVIVNNVIYNPGARAIQLDYVPSEWRFSQYTPVNPRVSIVGNVIINGIDTRTDLKMIASQGDAYLEDNIAYDIYRKSVVVSIEGINLLKEKPVWYEGLKALPSFDVLQHIINNSGARPKDRDVVDKRIIADLLQGKGRIIDSQDDVGGYPVARKTTRKLNVPDAHINKWLNGFMYEVENIEKR